MRPKWPAPMPQPTTPVKGDVVLFTYAEYVACRDAAKRAAVSPQLRQLFETFGPYRVKPKRDSRGIIWRNRPFYWSEKGFYRPGAGEGRRRPLHQLIYEEHFKARITGTMGVMFIDGDYHNFQPENLRPVTKQDIARRNQPYISPERRSEIRGKWATKHSRELTSLLLKNHQTKNSNENGNKLKFLSERFEKITNGPRR